MEIQEMDSLREVFQQPDVLTMAQGNTESPLLNSQEDMLEKGSTGGSTYMPADISTQEIPNIPDEVTSLRDYSGGYADETPQQSIRNVVGNVEEVSNEGVNADISNNMKLRSKSGENIEGYTESGFIEGPEGRTVVYTKPYTKENETGVNGEVAPKGSDGFRDKFMEYAIKQIGFNPFTFNPNQEAMNDLKANYNSIVHHIFGGGVNARYLTPEQNEFLQKQLKLYYDMKVGIYGKKGELGKSYLDHMLTNFDKDKPTIHGKYVVDREGKVIGLLPSDAESTRKTQSEELTMRKKIEDLVAKDLKTRFGGKVQYDSLSGTWQTEPGSDPNMIRKVYTEMKKKYYDKYKISYDPSEFEIPYNEATYVKGEPGNTADAVKYLDGAANEAQAKERAQKLAKSGWKKEHLKLAIGRSKWR